MDDTPVAITTVTGTDETVPDDLVSGILAQLCYPGEPPGALVELARKRGRFHDSMWVSAHDAQASWSPNRSNTAKGSSGMTCYHNNQVLSALQVRQLLHTVEVAGEHPETASPHAQELFKRAGSLLGWLYGGSKKVAAYASAFSSEAIDASELVPQIDAIRLRFALGEPLHKRAA